MNKEQKLAKNIINNFLDSGLNLNKPTSTILNKELYKNYNFKKLKVEFKNAGFSFEEEQQNVHTITKLN